MNKYKRWTKQIETSWKVFSVTNPNTATLLEVMSFVISVIAVVALLARG